MKTIQKNEERVRAPIVVTHKGGVSFAAQIRSHRIITDQPTFAGGTDAGPAPLELLGASLGSCIALYVQQFCAARNLPYEGMRVEIEQRGAKAPARVEEFTARVILPEEIPEQYAAMLDKVASSCPAHFTLSHGATVTVEILIPARA